MEVRGEDATTFDEAGLCNQDISGQRRERIPSEDKLVLECGGIEPGISQLLERRKDMRQILINQLLRPVEESVRSLSLEAEDERGGIVMRRSPFL